MLLEFVWKMKITLPWYTTILKDFTTTIFVMYSSATWALQPILITFCQPIDPFWNDIFQLQTAQEVAVWWSLSDNRGESGYRRRYSWLHARHFIFHARVPIVPSWQQFRLSYCVAWFLLIPRWLEWSGQSQHNCSALRSKKWKVSKGGAGQKFHRFPSETYVVRVKYQKLAKSVQGNWGFWINFSLEEVCHLFEVECKCNM